MPSLVGESKLLQPEDMTKHHVEPSYDPVLASKGHYDGQFVIGLMTSGVYSLPSCALHPGEAEEVRLFSTQAAARYAGLRPCKICRPDRFYEAGNDEVALFNDLTHRVEATPQAFPDVRSLALQAELNSGQIEDFYRDHAHLAPMQWLTRVKVSNAARALIDKTDTIADIAMSSGFKNEAAFQSAFFEQMRMTPAAYRALDAKHGFSLSLPKGYRSIEVLAYQARDPESISERSEGNRIWKALNSREGAVVLELTIGEGAAEVRVHGKKKSSRAAVAKLHADALAMLGLVNDVGPFERSHPALVKPRRGLRVPLLPDGFDALCWGIIGQQINIRFASSLRREITALAGVQVEGMRTHPTPEALANLSHADLTTRRFSRSKAQYLLDAAQAVVSGTLKIDELPKGSAIAAESALTSQRGIGIWTARYVLMRRGFADIAPVGDSGLAAALQRLHRLPERPDSDQSARLMSLFTPNRSLATMHLWSSLADPQA
jgi:AraC family transcriptional regulator, regulatory protein of adaptative response / DNA-3-methyladenine glycosylase II